MGSGAQQTLTLATPSSLGSATLSKAPRLRAELRPTHQQPAQRGISTLTLS